MTLTIFEICDLARFAGLVVDERGIEDMDTELTIEPCPVIGVHDEPDGTLHYAHIAYLAEYPDEGVMPLGKAERSRS